jgi:hypothetical protein
LLRELADAFANEDRDQTHHYDGEDETCGPGDLECFCVKDWLVWVFDHACAAYRKSRLPPLLLNIPPPMVPEITINYTKCGVSLKSQMHVLGLRSRRSETHVGFAYGFQSAKPVIQECWHSRSPTHFSCGCSVIDVFGILILKELNDRLEMSLGF